MSGAAAPIVACVQWVDLRPEIDPIHATVTTDARRAGLSDADRAAFEVALRLGAARAAPVWLASVAPPEAEATLAGVGASGADRILRIDGVDGGASAGRVAAALAPVCATAAVVVCGDIGPVGGSGAVPAMLAHHLGAAQALGVLDVGIDGDAVTAVRRLDGGRRERVVAQPPAVISTEGSAATLRRAPLDRLAGGVAVEVVAVGAAPPERQPVVVTTTAWRPRPRFLAPPADADPRRRIIALTGALVERTPPRRVELDPPDAAETILDQLRAWGYLEGP